MNRTLRYDEARAFYDRFGGRQDHQHWYEDAATDVLRDAIPWRDVHDVLEWGCGTGRFAATLLREHLPPDARWTGIDLSDEMRRLSAARLAPWQERVTIAPSEGPPRFPVPDASQDAVISTYVLDLMPEQDIAAFFAESARVLRTGGWLGVCSLYRARRGASGLVARLWILIHRLRPRAVGGCRPLELAPFVEDGSWSRVRHDIVRPFGLASEVLVLQRAGRRS